MIWVHSSRFKESQGDEINRSEFKQVSQSTVSFDVLQGAVLGHLLFNMLVNVLPHAFRSKCLLFVNDVKLWMYIKSPKDAQVLQQDFDALIYLVNRISVALHGCKYIQEPWCASEK